METKQKKMCLVSVAIIMLGGLVAMSCGKATHTCKCVTITTINGVETDRIDTSVETNKKCSTISTESSTDSSMGKIVVKYTCK